MLEIFKLGHVLECVLEPISLLVRKIFKNVEMVLKEMYIVFTVLSSYGESKYNFQTLQRLMPEKY